MSFYTDIKTSAQYFEPTATVHIANKSEHDRSTQDITYPAVRIGTDAQFSVRRVSGNLMTNDSYTIDFCDTDDWENTQSYEQADENSFEIMERMRIFADSTINYYLNMYPLALPAGQFVSWQATPIFRRGANFETGVSIRITLPKFGVKQC